MKPRIEKQIWISAGPSTAEGDGTQAHPFNGSTPEKFDAILQNHYNQFNLEVNLLEGLFASDLNHTWVVRSGWTFQGQGIDKSVIKMVGAFQNDRQPAMIASSSNEDSEFMIVQDLTLDNNWQEIGKTAPIMNGEPNVKVGVIGLWGSDIIVQRVKALHGYGSLANGLEMFQFFVAASRFRDANHNQIQNCIALEPFGNYGNPFAIVGFFDGVGAERISHDGLVAYCKAFGINDGLNNGFTSGGVNTGSVHNLTVLKNEFTDCYCIAYGDTGSLNGIKAKNNVLIRGWCGFNMAFTGDKPNIAVEDNQMLIQNRVVGGHSYGIANNFGKAIDFRAYRNRITFDHNGKGLDEFWGIGIGPADKVDVRGNMLGPIDGRIHNQIVGTNVTCLDNRDFDGNVIPGLEDRTP